MFRHTQEVAAKRLAMCTTRSKPSTKQKKIETTPSIRLRAVELCQLLTIISIESIHSPRIYQVFYSLHKINMLTPMNMMEVEKSYEGNQRFCIEIFVLFFFLHFNLNCKTQDIRSLWWEHIFFRISLRQKHWSACNLQIEFNENTNKNPSITILIRLFS